MNAKYGKLYVTDVIPAGTYPGQNAASKIATVWNILVTGERMPDDLAYAIVKIIFEKKADLIAVHKEAENIDYKYQLTANSPVPWHPGALKYFAEHGLKM
jgi:TRAP transporter TAXI family solute receptor